MGKAKNQKTHLASQLGFNLRRRYRRSPTIGRVLSDDMQKEEEPYYPAKKYSIRQDTASFFLLTLPPTYPATSKKIVIIYELVSYIDYV